MAIPANAQEGFQDPVFDLQAILVPPLNARVLKRSVADGLVTEEVMFHSETDGDKVVDIFAFFCYPEGAKGLPAFVWNQSGCYQASTYFPLLGARRGYAGLCIDFPIPGYRSTGNYPINSGIPPVDDPRQAPIYHGAVALLRAVSFLESRQEVDPDRIGMAGSSWGGFFTTLMVGVDPRLKAGSSMFGCGALELGNAWWDSAGNSANFPPGVRERWATTLDPALRLPHRTTPMAWFTVTNDTFYWLPAVMESYQRAGGTKHLSLLPNWDHGLTPALDEQVFAWLDVHLKGAPDFIRVEPIALEHTDDGRLFARWKFDGPRRPVRAELRLSYGESGNWVSRYWKALDAELEDGSALCQLPATSWAYFIFGTVVDADGFLYSTPLLQVLPPGVGLQKTGDALEYNGCSVWGDFEPGGIQYLQGLGYMGNAQVSPEGRNGTQCLLLRESHTLRDIYYPQGVLHRFQCYMKSEQPIEVTLTLTERYDQRTATAERVFRVGAEWTPLILDFAPHAALWSKIFATVKLPDGATALVDDVSFSPIGNVQGKE